MRSTPRSRSEARLAVVALALLAAPSCTLFAGAPWGEADLSLGVAFQPPDGRVDDDGALLTPKDYALHLESMTLTVDAVALGITSDAAAPTTFDPANPPAGYSLCHNGHCHAADGRLVDYDDIARELGGAGGSSERLVSRAVVDGPIELVGPPVALALDVCSDGCALPRGILTRITVPLSSLIVRAVVRDRRVGDAARLPAEGVKVALAVPIDGAIEASVDGAIDDESPSRVVVDGRLEVSEGLFDGVDWGSVPGIDATTDPVAIDDEGARAAVAEALLESTLVVEVTRPQDALVPEGEIVLW